MADRYWVGGTGTWNNSSTANWSTSSGGSSGASAPTTSDNVFFDQAGTYTVTLGTSPACATLNHSAGTVTFSGTGTPTIAGGFTLANTATWSATGNITFTATSSVTITTNGVQIDGNIIFNGASGTWTLGSALTLKASTSKTITLTNGTFSTSGSNYNLTCSGITVSANTNTKTLSLNGSTVTLDGGNFVNSSTGNFTLNAGTSTVVLTTEFNEGFRIISSTDSLTFYNFTMSDTLISGMRFDGSFVFNDLTINAVNGATVPIRIFLYNDMTVNGVLTMSNGGASAPWKRYFLCGNSFTTPRTITAATTTLEDVDFANITGAGGGSWSGTRLGNCGGNSNITFASPKTVYYSAATAGNWSSTNWATTSGGGTAATNFPLAQDTAIIDDSSGTGTLTFNGIQDYGPNVCNLDASGRTTALTLAFTKGPLFVGNFNISSNVTPSGTGGTISGAYSAPTDWSQASACLFAGATTQSITTNGKSFTCPPIIRSPNTVFKLIDALTVGSTLNTRLFQGTIDFNGQTLTTGRFQSDSTDSRTLAFGSGNLTVNGTGTVIDLDPSTNLSTSGTPVINVSNGTATATTVSLGTLDETNSISVNFTTGTYSLTFTGASKNLDFTGFAGTLTNAARTVYGNVKFVSGMTLNAGTNAMTFAATSGSKTIESGTKTLNFPVTFNGAGGTWTLVDNLTVGSTRTLTHTNGTLDLSGKTLNAGASYTTASGTKNLTFNGGTLTCANSGATAFNNAQPTGFTTTAGTGTGTISMTSASAKTFVGGGSTFNCTLDQGGAGALTITGDNTFNDIKNTYTASACSVLFTAATTNTFINNFSLAGSAGNLVTIGSVTAASHTLSKASGTVSVSYCSISRSSATGGATWNAYTTNGNVDGGNNTGWIFEKKIIADVGSYAITGQNANLLAARYILGNTGSYSITGFAAELTATTPGEYSINVEHGSYALTGSNASLLAARFMSAESGAYIITGFDATLTQGGVTPVVIVDTHDGDKVRKRFKKEVRDQERRKKQILEAYERLVEGKVIAVEDIVEEFTSPEQKTGSVAFKQQYIDFDRLLNDLNAAERLWQLYLAMDDEDVLALL
jgi:hypothetical protein